MSEVRFSFLSIEIISIFYITVRYYCCELLKIVYFKNDPVDEEKLQLAEFYSRTGKRFFDLKDYSTASSCYEQASAYVRTLVLPSHSKELHKTTFSLHIWKLTLFWELKNYDQAFQFLEKIKDMIHPAFPEDVVLLEQTLFNIAIDNKEKKGDPSLSIKLLQDALKFSQMADTTTLKLQELEMLANLSLELGQFESAWKYITQAKEIKTSANTHFLMTRFFLLTQQDSLAQEHLIKMLSFKNLSFAASLSMCRALVSGTANFQLAATGYRILQDQTNNIDEEIEVKLHLLQSLLMPSHLNVLDAGVLSEEIIQTLQNSQTKIKAATSKNFQFIMWNTAVLFYEKSEFKEAAEWIKRCLRLAKSDDTATQAKSYRILCRCHLENGDFQQAQIYGEHAINFASNNATAWFLLFKVHVHLKQTSQGLLSFSSDSQFISFLSKTKAKTCLEKMIQSPEGHSFLDKCIHLSRTQELSDVSITAFQLWIESNLRENSEKIHTPEAGKTGIVIRTLLKLFMEKL